MRAIRRHHRERLKSKRKSYSWVKGFGGSDSYMQARLVRCINTPKPCSCYMCGNPRKYFHEKTVQERRNNVSEGKW